MPSYSRGAALWLLAVAQKDQEEQEDHALVPKVTAQTVFLPPWTRFGCLIPCSRGAGAVDLSLLQYSFHGFLNGPSWISVCQTNG